MIKYDVILFVVLTVLMIFYIIQVNITVEHYRREMKKAKEFAVRLDTFYRTDLLLKDWFENDLIESKKEITDLRHKLSAACKRANRFEAKAKYYQKLAGAAPHPSPVCALVTPSPEGEGFEAEDGFLASLEMTGTDPSTAARSPSPTSRGGFGTGEPFDDI